MQFLNYQTNAVLKLPWDIVLVVAKTCGGGGSGRGDVFSNLLNIKHRKL